MAVDLSSLTCTKYNDIRARNEVGSCSVYSAMFLLLHMRVRPGTHVIHFNAQSPNYDLNH